MRVRRTGSGRAAGAALAPIAAVAAAPWVVALALALVLALPAQAQAQAPPAAGAAAYAARWQATCAACHGAEGTSTLPTVPSVGGQPSFYVTTQLFLFREGRRNDHPQAAAMSALAKDMKNDELRGWSDFIATLPPPRRPEAAPDPARLARGRALAQAKHCLSCHGGDLAGGQHVPRVAHQREDYLLLTLRGFRSGARTGYTMAMAEAVAGLAPQDIEDLAHFLAHAPGP